MIADATWRRRVRQRLIGWYRRNARDLPWRHEPDGYRVWVSEIMLQQTQVATVIPYFERFVATFPTVSSLADASEDHVLRLWEGLGYYRRARQMHRAAQVIVAEHGGEFPSRPDEVRRLPGIGRYTAGAILSIAFGQQEPVLEANSMRLLCRLLGYDGDPRRASGQRLLWDAATALLPRKDPGELNQAMMELGSQLCYPREPRCDDCRLAPLCAAYQRGATATIPRPKQPTRYEVVREVAVVIWSGQHVYLRQCQPGERWAGLWDFPRFPVSEPTGTKRWQEVRRKTLDLTHLRIGKIDEQMRMTHAVTRYRIELTVVASRMMGRRHDGETWRWHSPKQLNRVPLNTTARKIARQLAPSS